MFLILAALIVMSLNAGATPQSSISQTYLTADDGEHRLTSLVRIGIYDPIGEPVGDILYLPGFGDRFDNQGPLIDQFTAKGFRVISFDYPSHGETTGPSLNYFSFTLLADLVRKVEAQTCQDLKRPLLVAGWSMGGLLAVRIAQASLSLPTPRRTLAGMILFAPGISVKTIVGQPNFAYPLGEITDSTLTHDPNPAHVGLPKPRTPFSSESVFFAAKIKANSILSQIQAFPRNLPTLMIVAGDDDLYVNSKVVRAWAEKQNQKNETSIQIVSSPGARHEVQSETDDWGGSQARMMAADFAEAVVSGQSIILPDECATILVR